MPGASGRTTRNRPPACAVPPTGVLREREPEPYSSRGLFSAPDGGCCGFDSELQLKRNFGMLFPPQRDERRRQPAPVPTQLMDNRMASRTKGDQPGGGVAAGAAVMDGALIPCPTALTAIAVAGENGVAMSAEAPTRMRGLPVAAAARPATAGSAPHRQNSVGCADFSKDQYS